MATVRTRLATHRGRVPDLGHVPSYSGGTSGYSTNEGDTMGLTIGIVLIVLGYTLLHRAQSEPRSHR